jgi:hypothetical protein
MRSSLAKAVRNSFSREIAEQNPEFVPERSEQVPAGDRLFVWSFAENLRFYIYLQINQKSHQDSFTVELACSSSRFPFGHPALGPTPRKDGSVRFRLPQLYRDEWRPKTAWEPWWWIGPPQVPDEVTSKVVKRAAAGERPLLDEQVTVEDALPLVEAQVQNTLDRIKRFGIPFFERFARPRSETR